MKSVESSVTGIWVRLGAAATIATVVLAFSTAESNADDKQAPSPTPNVALAPKVVLVLPPALTFESLQDERPLDPGRYHPEELTKHLSAVAERELRARGFVIIPAPSYPVEHPSPLIKLQPLAGRMSRGSVTQEARGLLSELSPDIGAAAIFSQCLRVRVGSSGSIDLMFGGLTSGQNQTVLSASLVSPAAGSVTWKNQMMLRKVVRPDSASLDKALSVLYETLK